MRIKTRYKGPAKFAPSYSGPHEVISVRGVLLTVRELSTNRVYQIHHDRASNPLLTPSFDRGPASDPIDSDPDLEPKDANPIENEREPGENLEPASNPDNSLIRTRSGRVSRPHRDPDYEYQLPLIEVSLASSQSASSHTNPSCSNASRRHANFEPSALLQSMQTQAEIVDALEEAGERVCFLVDRGVNAMLLRETGTLYVFDEPKNDFVSLCDGRTLTNDRKRQRASRPPNFRELSLDDVLLPWQEIDFPGFAEGRHKRRYYGFTPEWRNYAIQQAKEEKSCSEPAPPTIAQPEPELENESRPEREPEHEPEPTVAAGPPVVPAVGPPAVLAAGPPAVLSTSSQPGPPSIEAVEVRVEPPVEMDTSSPPREVIPVVASSAASAPSAEQQTRPETPVSRPVELEVSTPQAVLAGVALQAELSSLAKTVLLGDASNRRFS